MAKKNYIESIKQLQKGGGSKDSEFIIQDKRIGKNIIKNIEGNAAPDYVYLSELLWKEIFHKDINISDLPIESLRLIFSVLHLAKEFHYNQEHAPYTPSLFQDEFMTETNSYVSFTIPNSIISPSREAKRIKDALLLLNDETARWVRSYNEKGELVEDVLRFIEKPQFMRGKMRFEVSTYWVNLMANIESYNRIIFDLVYNIPNTKQVMFSLWLQTIPEYKEAEFSKETYKSWTKLALTTMQEKFSLKELSANYIQEKFLKPLQVKLYSFNDKSFAFKYEKGMFYITAIQVKGNIQIEQISKVASYENEIKYSISYLQQRHKIDKDSLEHIAAIYKNSGTDKLLMEEAYKNLKFKIRTQKSKMTDLKGFKFLDLWQEEIVTCYLLTERSKNHPKGYPKVSTSS